MFSGLLDWYYHHFLKPRLFLTSEADAEKAHEQVINLLAKMEKHRRLCRLLAWLCNQSSAATEVSAMGIKFPNPIGLAAGLDKNCLAPHALAALGFGSLELGGVVPLPQPGNHRPRVWRDSANQELFNTMGFPSDGLEAVQKRCAVAQPFPVPTGCNLGKNKDTSPEETSENMGAVMAALYPYFHWFTVNVSSPNTAGLRALQTIESLRPLLRHLDRFRKSLAARYSLPRPRGLVVKFAPDLTDDQLVNSVHCALAEDVAGINLGNTKQASLPDGRVGGRSGPSLYPRTLEMIKLIAPHTKSKCTLIACGGINSTDRVAEVLDNGADLVQVFTTLIFNGPGQISRLVRGLE